MKWGGGSCAGDEFSELHDDCLVTAMFIITRVSGRIGKLG